VGRLLLFLVLSGFAWRSRVVGVSRSLRLLRVSVVGDVLPILENSTACTIVNANYLRPVVFGSLVGIPLD
jgi:hypothetical protein